MSRRPYVRKIDLDIFRGLLKSAQDEHNKHGEPIPDMGSHSEAKVDSCLQTPFQTFGGRSLYQTFNRKAAALFYFLIKNHCLPNGNKRMAILTLVYFVMVNDRRFDISQEGMYNLAKRTAMSQDSEKAVRTIRKTLRKCVRKKDPDLKRMNSYIRPKKNRKQHRCPLHIVIGYHKFNTYFDGLGRRYSIKTPE